MVNAGFLGVVIPLICIALRVGGSARIQRLIVLLGLFRHRFVDWVGLVVGVFVNSSGVEFVLFLGRTLQSSILTIGLFKILATHIDGSIAVLPV